MPAVTPVAWREATAGGLCLGKLDAVAVSEFVLAQARRSWVGSAKCMVTRLRALLRFLHVEGEIEYPLADGRPSIAGWRLASLVKALDVRSVARLLGSCDRRTRVGRRDFAITTLLSRLGLRAGEVAALRLSDMDWRAGEIMVRGEGRRQERLPLPADVGDTLAGWLARGRPRRESVFVFRRVRATYDGLSAGAVSQIVRRACQRGGLQMAGAHRLRHTAATEMLPRRRELDRGRSGAASPRSGCHLDLCQGRPARTRSGRHAEAKSGRVSELDRHLTDYLTVRRALGFKLIGEGQLLAEFVAFATEAGQPRRGRSVVDSRWTHKALRYAGAAA